jgi:predicted nuclease of predicted toxin-antitoxin system
LTAFLTDEDVSPRVAEIARGLKLDVVSVRDRGRLGWSDEDQLRAAAADGRVFVTYNRDDYIRLTRRFFHEREPHAGVLIVPGSIPRREPRRLVRALARWEQEHPAPVSYLCTFLDDSVRDE